MLVFQTPKGSDEAIAIQGLGRCGADGKGGITLDAAAKVMHELQDADGASLTGDALWYAATDFAEERGLVVNDVTEADVARFEEKLGGTISKRPSILERSHQEAAWLARGAAADTTPEDEAPKPAPTGAVFGVGGFAGSAKDQTSAGVTGTTANTTTQGD